MFLPNEQLIKDFIQVLGQEHVHIHDNQYNIETTFKTFQNILGILIPQNREQLVECVKIANTYKVSLYPISRGKNIGLGGKIPVQSNCFILDLSRMNKILEFNEELAYIRIESGVTQEQVTDFLKSVNSNLILSITGSFPDSSIVGNVIERGDTSGPYKERIEHACNLDLILGNGESLVTGFGRHQDSKLSNISKFGVGADYTGLFIQSNFSIVVSLTIWLSPRPKYVEKIGIRIKNHEQLSHAIDIIRDLEIKGVIDDCSFWNDYKILSVCTKFPTEQINSGQTDLNTWKQKVSDFLRIGKWNATIMLRSESQKINRERTIIIKNALKRYVDKIISTEDILFKFIKTFQKPIEMITKKSLSALLSLSSNPESLGLPNNNNIKSLYWCKDIKNKYSNDPEKDKVGFIWGCLATPYKSVDIINVIELIEKIFCEHDFVPNICILGITKRLVTIAPVIVYDRESLDKEIDNKAINCHDILIKEAIKRGYMPNRLGIQSMNLIPKSNTYYESFIKNLKNSLDPNNIISPGRYEFFNQ